MATVLVVDDDPIVREVLSDYLADAGHMTLQAGDGAAAKQIFVEHPVDLVVLDVMMPRSNGLEVCRWIRERSDAAVILVTARGEESDRIIGLELGADDYVVKPFSPREVSARVTSILRRTKPSSAGEGEGLLQVGDLEVEPAARIVRVRGSEVALTAKEFDILHLLMRHPKRVFSRGQIMQAVWGYESSSASEVATVTVHVSRLRDKIERDPSRPEILHTVHGVGYRVQQ